MDNNKKIGHQFLKEEFFFPNWEVETLIIGTFNPNCGEKTDYYYGRCRNNFWRIIEKILHLKYMSLQNSFEEKLKIMSQEKFGCADIIQSIILMENTKPELICGSGYSDQVLFNQQKCSITYQFEDIKVLIKEKKVKKIINTWGLRDKPKLFVNNIDDLQNFCELRNISFIRKCPSPSGRLRSANHKEELLNFYKEQLFKTST